jgi:hypothetical protein
MIVAGVGSHSTQHIVEGKAYEINEPRIIVFNWRNYQLDYVGNCKGRTQAGPKAIGCQVKTKISL